MTPTQFCVWLCGYAAAKPEVLDPQIREELDAIISRMVADKLREESDQTDYELRRRQIELEMVKIQAAHQNQLAKQAKRPSQAHGPLGGGIMYASNTADAQGVAVQK